MCEQRNNISSYNQVWVGPFTKESPSFKDHFCQICVCGWSQIGVFHCTTKRETTKRLFCFDCSNYFLHYLQEQLLWTSCPFWSTSRVIYSRWRRCCPTWTWLKGILTAKWRMWAEGEGESTNFIHAYLREIRKHETSGNADTTINGSLFYWCLVCLFLSVNLPLEKVK